MALKASQNKVTFEINVFYDRGAIHVTSNGVRGFHVAISNKPVC